MHSARVPCTVTTLVTRVAVGRRSNSGVGHMVCRLSIGWCMRAIVASAAVVRRYHLGVVPVGWLPQWRSYSDRRCMTCVTVCSAGSRNVISAFCRGNRTVMTRGTGTGNGYTQIVLPDRGTPRSALRVVASYAICRRVDVVGRFANATGPIGAVTSKAVSCRVERTVAWHGTRPACCGVVATFAVSSHRCVNRHIGAGKWLGSYAIGTRAAVLVTSHTLCGNGDVGVQQARVPRRIATFVARVTVGRARQSGIRNVRCSFSQSWVIRARVTSCTLTRHWHLGGVMTPRTRFPGSACGAVAAYTIGSGRKVGATFASSRRSIVASEAIRRSGVRRVVGLGTKPSGRGCMATLTICRYPRVNGRGRLARDAIGSSQVARSTLIGHRGIGMETPRIP
jgi:hypothetical protein